MSELPLKIKGLISHTVGASQMALVIKNPPANARDLRDGSIPEWGRSPGGSHDNPLQYSYLENPHGQRSLEGYSSWIPEDSDTTERLTLRLSHSVTGKELLALFCQAVHPMREKTSRVRLSAVFLAHR